MSRFNLQDYETVAARIARFHGEHDAGSIITDLVEISRNENGSPAQYIVRASVLVDGVERSTGYAEEIVGTSMVNKTSALENCETSAVGRALANLNYAPSGGDKRPSREEMEKVQRYDNRQRVDDARAVGQARSDGR